MASTKTRTQAFTWAATRGAIVVAVVVAGPGLLGGTVSAQLTPPSTERIRPMGAATVAPPTANLRPAPQPLTIPRDPPRKTDVVPLQQPVGRAPRPMISPAAPVRLPRVNPTTRVQKPVPTPMTPARRPVLTPRPPRGQTPGANGVVSVRSNTPHVKLPAPGGRTCKQPACRGTKVCKKAGACGTKTCSKSHTGKRCSKCHGRKG